MFCSKCGQPVSEDDNVCRMCGNVLNSTAPTVHNKQAKTRNTSLILLGIGVGIAILVCAISLIGYGRIYFFDGYDITSYAWIAAIGCTLGGLIIFIKNIITFGVSTLLENEKKRFIVAVLLICVIPAIFILSAIGKTSRSSGSDYNYLNDPNYYQNAFESCHSTYEHKQAIYSYDLNDDNSISKYEIELFLKAHPRVTNDKQFMDWMESRVG